MRILHLSESFGWSGGAAQLLSLSEGLRERGCEVHLACPPGGDLWKAAEARGLPLHPFAPSSDFDLKSAWKVSRLLCGLRADILHAHHPRAHAIALLAKQLTLFARPRLVVTRRVTFPPGRGPFSRWKYRSRAVDAYIAATDPIRGMLAEAGIEPSRLFVIPAGVDLSAFNLGAPDAAFLKEQGLDRETPVVGLVGHYGSLKGHEVFLRAAGELKRRGEKAVYLVAGRGTEDERLRHEAKKAGLITDDCRFLGLRRDVPRVLSCLSVSVNAATGGEGTAGALRESLAMGIPVVASRIGGNAELVRSGKTGELFPPGDWMALADAIQGLLRDRARAKRLADSGRHYVQENLSAEKMVERTLELYGSVMRGAAAGGGK